MEAFLAAPLFATPAAAGTTAAVGSQMISPAISAMVAGPGPAAGGGMVAPLAGAAGGGGGGLFTNFLTSLTYGDVMKTGFGIFGATSTILGGLRSADLLEDRADMMEIRARSEEIRGLEEGNEIMRRTNEAQAAAIARFGAAGIAVGEGAPQQVFKALSERGSRSLKFSSTNAQIAAATSRFQGRQLRSRAINVRRQGFTDAIGGMALLALS